MNKGLVLSWLVTYWSHSLIALSGMWLASRWLRERNLAVEETGWKAAIFLTLVTASLQVGLTQGAGYRPVAGSLELSAVTTASLGEPSSPTSSTEVEKSEVAGGAGEAVVAPGGQRSNPLSAERTRNGLVPAAAPGGIAIPWMGAMDRLGRSATWLSAIWLAFVALLAARLVGCYVLLLEQLEGRRVLSDGPFVSLLARLCERGGIVRGVRLSICDRLSIPLALGLRRWEVCLPGRLTEEFDTEEQETVLAHELAHLVRRDAIWLLGARAVAGSLFFQPLNFLALARLRVLSELRSDDWAVAQTGRPITLARCLTRVASWRTNAWTNLPTPAMAGAPGSQFGDRVRRLLSRSYPEPAAAVPAWFKGVVVLLGLVLVAAAPGAVAPRAPEPPQPDGAPAVVIVQPNELGAPRPVPKPTAAPRVVTVPAPQPRTFPPSSIAAPVSPRPVAAPLASARYAHLAEDGTFRGSDDPAGASQAPDFPRADHGMDSDSEPDSDSDSDSDWDSDSDSDSDSEDSDDPELEALEERLESEIEAFEEAFEAEAEPMFEAFEEQLEKSQEQVESALEDLYDEFEDGLEIDVEGALEALQSWIAKAESGSDREAVERAFAGQERELSRFEREHQRALEQIERELERKLDNVWERDLERELERAFEIYERANEQRMEGAARQLEHALRALESAAVRDEDLPRLHREALDKARSMLPTPAELEEMRSELAQLRLEIEPDLEIVEEMRVDFEQALEQWRQQYRADLGRHIQEIRDQGRAAAPGAAEPEH